MKHPFAAPSESSLCFRKPLKIHRPGYSFATFPMKFTSLQPVLTSFVLLLLFAACAGEERGKAPAGTEPGATVLAGTSAPDTSLLTSLRFDLLRTAFRNLDDYTFSRIVRTEQLDEAGSVTARESQTIRYRPEDGAWSAAVEPVDETGEFDYGAFDRFTSDVEETDLASLAGSFIPEDPPYLSARSWENFTYSTVPDTLINGVRAGVLEVRALPEATEQSTRHALLYYDPQSYAVVALYQVISRPALVFEESTSLFVQARPGPGGQWLPDTTSVSTHIRLPLTETRRFRTTSRFSDYSNLAE